MARVFVGIGSNEGDRQAHVRLAHERLTSLVRPGRASFSRIYETDPVGPVRQGRFLNTAAELQAELAPQALLAQLAAIEADTGRPSVGQRVKWGPRTLDLDLLLYDQRIIDSADLIIPHPLMHERWFVLRPLADLDPHLLHPVLKVTVAELLARIEEKEGRQSIVDC